MPRAGGCYSPKQGTWEQINQINDLPIVKKEHEEHWQEHEQTLSLSLSLSLSLKEKK
jgi:hypothetical protein